MRTLLTILLTALTISAFAQPPGGKGNRNNGVKGEIFGNIIDSLSGEPVGYATVVALKQPSGDMAGGAVSADDGSFSVSELPLGKYTLKVSFVGYAPKFIEEIELTKSNTTYQLKDLKFSPTTLQTVEVIGGTPEITYEIDKKVVNVEDMQNTAGQTALEVLENVPSIIVSADGTVTLRGSSSFTLLIDGVPTILEPRDALAQIPASSIQDIEIITNPSAKFNAEGSSGVINIITKKNKLEGMSCLVNGTAGLFNNYNADAAFSVKKEKFAFDLNANYSLRSRPEDKIENRHTEYDSLVNDLNAQGLSGHSRGGWGGGMGFQWTPNSGHKLVIKTDYSNRNMNFFEELNYENYDDGVLVEKFFTDDRTQVKMWSNSSSLFYQHNIKRNKNHYISFQAISNLRFVDQADSTLSYDGDQNLIRGNAYTELGPSNMYRFNLDYRLPVKENYKFETGVQIQFGRSFDDGDNYQYNDSTDSYEHLPLFSSDVNYVRDVHAGYAIFGGKVKNFGFQAGVRMEYTYRKVSSDNFPNFTTINRPDWFPSAHLSYSFDDKSQLLLSYSRRIERPRSWYFEPFITWESPYGVRSGNPDLNPTYISVVDFSYMKPIKRKGFWSLESYFRRSTGTTEWVQTVYEEGILIRRPYNVGISQRLGIEGAFNYNFVEWYQLNAGVNLYYFDLRGSVDDNDFSANSFNYNFNLRNTFNLKGWVIQLNGRYRSGSVEPQGRELWQITGDVSLKKSFYNNKLTFNLNARNAFLTAREIDYIYTENVTIYQSEIPKGPMLSLTVSLKLNNYEKFYRDEQLDDF
ncbi:MAG: TonB-dependent receptor [Crocinitomicaceae bacterium]|nr:TonB-dependent receptor [Crocinitomicaceae bacterium]